VGEEQFDIIISCSTFEQFKHPHSDKHMNEKPPQPVIKLENISKRFETIAEKPQSILETIIDRFSLRHRGRFYQREPNALWAVKNVDLEVAAGESIGILGRNGSGKSTLLKLITRIVQPTTGRIMVAGRVSALLELGTGFHPDMTGRENIFLNASLLGLGKEYIEESFESIVAFSELGEFIDIPVKFYSSGMYMRLGFSVAVHVKPDILIIDEILAVGDQSFQEKCFNHIYDMKRQGVTIFLVSHSLDMMRKLCDRLVWMDRGVVCAQGDSEEVIQQYLDHLQKNAHQPLFQVEKEFERLGTGDIEIIDVRLLNRRGEEQEEFMTGDEMTVEISFDAHRPVVEPEFGLAIYREDGVQVNGPNNQFAGVPIDKVDGKGKVFYKIHALPLLPANYVVSAAVHNSRYMLTYDHHVKAYYFRVGSGGTRELYGLVELPATWWWTQESEDAVEVV
jgi:lipopolysaccharide transport system ATP-binding protein